MKDASIFLLSYPVYSQICLNCVADDHHHFSYFTKMKNKTLGTTLLHAVRAVNCVNSYAQWPKKTGIMINATSWQWTCGWIVEQFVVHCIVHFQVWLLLYYILLVGTRDLWALWSRLVFSFFLRNFGGNKTKAPKSPYLQNSFLEITKKKQSRILWNFYFFISSLANFHQAMIFFSFFFSPRIFFCFSFFFFFFPRTNFSSQKF